MGKLVANGVFIGIVLLLCGVMFANCVPTSVLVNSKSDDGAKVKRTTTAVAPESVPAKAVDTNVVEKTMPKPAPQKRGAVNSQYFGRDYGVDVPNDIYGGLESNNVPRGVWEDIDQDFEEYPPQLPFRNNKGGYYNYDKMLNPSSMYEEPLALPMQYPYPRYYQTDRKKRSNLALRLKRETKLSSADIMALVALVEAGQRARLENENEENGLNYPMNRNLPSPYEGSQENNGEWWDSSWEKPSIQYYGSPYTNDEQIPRYDILKDQHQKMYPGSKRFMVSKKKRSIRPQDYWRMGQQESRYLKNPASMPFVPGFDSRSSLSDVLDNDQKYYSKYN